MTLGRSDAHWDDFEIERQLRFLASVSEELSATDDWAAALIRVARGVVDDGLATACVIEVLGENGPVQVAIADVDPAREPVLATIFARTDPGASEDGPRRLALRSGQAQLINDIAPDFWARIAYDDAHRAALESLQVRSIISVPMAARGRLVGVVTLGHTTQAFAPAHLAVAQDLAGRVGLAVDNARLRQAAEEAWGAGEHPAARLERERESEQQPRREAERSAAQLARLQAITARLSRARTVAEVADVVVADAPAGVGAANASLSL